MRKMILVLFSGLLIACMAGSAIAAPDSAQIWDEKGDYRVDLNAISLSPGDTQSFTFYVELYALDKATTFDYSTKVVSASGAGSNVDQIHVTTPSTFTIPAGVKEFKDIGVIQISLDKDAPANAKYTINIGGKDFVIARATVTSVPEYPTVAAPIAAVLGLLFVFGRKKEGL